MKQFQNYDVCDDNNISPTLLFVPLGEVTNELSKIMC